MDGSNGIMGIVFRKNSYNLSSGSKASNVPSVLSDCLCSLVEGEQRFAFTMDIIVSNEEITNIEFKNTLIKVSKNFRYEEKELLESDDYKKLLSILEKYVKILKRIIVCEIVMN